MTLLSGAWLCSEWGVALISRGTALDSGVWRLLSSGCGVDQWDEALLNTGCDIAEFGSWRCSVGVWLCTVVCAPACRNGGPGFESRQGTSM